MPLGEDDGYEAARCHWCRCTAIGIGLLPSAASAFTPVDLLNDANVRIGGAAAGETAGNNVAAAGDVNGDGRDDFIVSANLADDNARGANQTLTTSAASGGGGDRTAPDTKIDKGPKKKSAKKKATFEFSSTEAGSTFKCKLDKGAFEPCTSPQKVKAKKGKHTFEVQATDAAGNTDATPATYSWKVKKKKKRK